MHLYDITFTHMTKQDGPIVLYLMNNPSFLIQLHFTIQLYYDIQLLAYILICIFTHIPCQPGAVLVVAVSFNYIGNTSKPRSATLPPNFKFFLTPTFAMEVLKVYTTEYAIPTCLSNDWENGNIETGNHFCSSFF